MLYNEETEIILALAREEDRKERITLGFLTLISSFIALYFFALGVTSIL